MNDIKYIFKKPFVLFEIENFLNNELYDGLKKNFPNFNSKIANKSMTNFKNGKFAFDTQSDSYKRELEKNIYVNKLHSLIFSKEFFYFFYKKLYLEFIKSRSSDLKHIIKLLRFPRLVNKIDKDNFTYYFNIFTNIKIEIQYSFMTNMSYIVPHTDSGEKLLSLMIYFPEYENLDSKFYSKEINYGTSFWNSKINNFNNVHQEGSLRDNFKQNSQKLLRPKFTGNKLIGFLKNPYSWHSVEPIDVHDNYIRKSININFYF
jgi:hypothetical protein